MAADAATGVTDPNFQPDVNSFWGVWSIDESGGTIAVGGEFTTFDGVAVQGIALLPSLFAERPHAAVDTDEPDVDRATRRRPRTLSWSAVDRQHPALGLQDLP